MTSTTHPSYYPPRIQTGYLNGNTGMNGNSSDSTSAADTDMSEQEYTARPHNAHLHASALWFQPPPGSSNNNDSTNDNNDRMNRGNIIAEHGRTGSGSGEIGLGMEGLSRPLHPHESERLAHLDRLKFFLATAPSRWDTASSSSSSSHSSSSSASGTGPSPSHPALNRFLLPSQEFVTCVLWNGLYHITGTDIVRALVFRFEAFGRPVKNMKKFEEGVFSDLRNLKPGVDACLEEPKVGV